MHVEAMTQNSPAVASVRARIAAPLAPFRGADKRAGAWTRQRLIRVAGNLAGATLAVVLLRPNLWFFVETHRPIGLIFAIQQAAVALVFLTRRAPRTVSRRPLDWVAAYAATFSPFLIRSNGYHPGWGVSVGFWIQLAGLVGWGWAFAKLARCYGLVPADRGLVTGGPYRIVRHPLYTSYLIGGIGFLLQSLSIRNIAVDIVAIAWQIVRIRAEERHLAGPAYAAYQARVQWRLIPGLW